MAMKKERGPTKARLKRIDLEWNANIHESKSIRVDQDGISKNETKTYKPQLANGKCKLDMPRHRSLHGLVLLTGTPRRRMDPTNTELQQWKESEKKKSETSRRNEWSLFELIGMNHRLRQLKR